MRSYPASSDRSVTSTRVTAAKAAEVIRNRAKRRRGIPAILCESEVGLGAEREVREMSGAKFWERGRGDHGGVVGGKRGGWEKDRACQPGRAGGRTQSGVRSHAT